MNKELLKELARIADAFEEQNRHSMEFFEYHKSKDKTSDKIKELEFKSYIKRLEAEIELLRKLLEKLWIEK